MSEDNQTIKTGILQTIRFYKQETSFIIGIFMDSETKREFSGKGTIVAPQVGLTYKLTGILEITQQWGEQLNFTMFETVLPKDTNGIFKYIVRLCKFVGVKVGNELVDTYGSKTLEIMKNDPMEITHINGITEKRAFEIQATLIENEKTEAVMVELESLLDVPGIRKNLPAELINRFRSNAAEVIKENPYILTSFPGTSFVMADRIAMNIGINPMSLDRKKEAVRHVLKENMSSGSVWMEERELTQQTAILINVMGVENGIESLFNEDIITIKNSCITSRAENLKWYTFVDADARENKIAQKLAEIMNNEPLLKTTANKRGQFDGI